MDLSTEDIPIIFEFPTGTNNANRSDQSIQNEVQTEVDGESEEEKERESEITRNFLAGKLSFTQYAAQIENEESQEETMETEENVTGNEEPSTSVTNLTLDIKPKPKRRIKRSLPPTLKGLVGEANLRYARGDHKVAEQMCLEVIRQIPTASEPFLTLAQIYETENPEKSLQFALIAAHLSPNDEDQWVRLALLSKDLGNLKQADACYAKAILANPTNINLHLCRIHFLESLGETRLVLKAKMRALNYISPDHHEILISIARELTMTYHSNGENAKAAEALDYVFKKCPNQVTSELANMMLELLLELKNYKYCLQIFVEYCDITLEIEMFTESEKEQMRVVSYQLPVALPIDLHIKFIICLIHLKSFDLIDPLISPLLAEEEGVDKNGDLYLDVAEALMAENRHSDALKLLVPLVKSKNFGMAAVWLRHAECLKECNLFEQAIDSYKKVMELAPLHLEMRHPLAELLIKLDRKHEALFILEQDETSEEIDPGLLFKKCKLLRELKSYNKYWDAGLLLLSRHCFTVRDRDEVEKLTSMQRPDKKGTLLKCLRAAKGENIVDTMAVFDSKNEPSVDEEFTLFKDMVETCMKRRRFDLMQRFTFTSLSSKRFKDYKQDLELMAIFACVFNEDSFHGYNLVRDLVQRDIHNKKCWNLYNLMIQRSDDCRHNRFLMRLLTRANVDTNIHILHANNCLVAGTYKYALSEYIQLYRIQEDPLFAFLIGVTLFQMASQKFSAKKDYLVVQGIGFLNIYKKLRGAEGIQEADYNIGRGYHQLGMLHSAVEYYKKVLNTKTNMTEKYPSLFDLKREAAYNLHLIYKASGAFDIAKVYLYKYIVV